jgi:16S rRNA (adenine1518-N6/adenine1519-N6)-dimethyltransferase
MASESNTPKSFLRETISLIRKYGIRPKKRLSQCFVVDERLIKVLIGSIDPKPSDVIVEIGAGLGALTLELAKHGSKIKAVEIDPALIRVLKDRLSSFSNVEIIQGDFMRMSLNGNIFTGNIPYHISTPVIFKILEKDYAKAVITLQKEVAERIVSKPGTRNYGRLTVSVNALAEPRILGFFPPLSFYPRPKVSHAVLFMRPSKRVEDTSLLSILLRNMFSQRNRLARTVLKNSLVKLYRESGLRSYPYIAQNIPEDKRVFELSVDQFIQLAQNLSRTMGEQGTGSTFKSS